MRENLTELLEAWSKGQTGLPPFTAKWWAYMREWAFQASIEAIRYPEYDTAMSRFLLYRNMVAFCAKRFLIALQSELI